jgi:exonuclease III
MLHPKGPHTFDEGLFDNITAEVGMIQDLGGNILLIGDFNARISAVDDYVDCRYFAYHMPETLPLGNDFLEVLPERHNSDKGGLKGWHNEFLDLCRSLGLFILNGRIIGDESRECTCFANGGSSLVDYMVASPALFDCATSFVVHKCPLFCGKECDSDHMPLSLNLQLP